MFQIVCDPSSGSAELCLTEITRSGSQIFVTCLVGVWQRNFRICGVCVCVCVCMTGWDLLPVGTHAHTHTTGSKITLPNTDQSHDKYL